MTPSQALGNSMHLVLHDYHKNGTDIWKSLDTNWIKEGYSDKKHEQESLEKAKKFLTEYLKSGLYKNANPIYLEQPFSFNISDLKIGGKMDRVDDLGDGEIEIIDYKTGANVPTQKDIDRDLQMSIYALAATYKGVLNHPIEKVKLSFYYFDNQKKVTTIRTKEQLEETRKELLAIRSEIEKSDFQCSGNKLCESCEFKMLCNG